MKTMKDFKGSDGDWYLGEEFQTEFGSIATPINTSGESTHISEVYQRNYDDPEGTANARLFANSKKLLEAAIELSKFIEERKDVGTPDYWCDMYDLHRALEQAINDSL